MAKPVIDRTMPGSAGLMFDCADLNEMGWQREHAAREALITRCTAPGCRNDAPWADRNGAYCAEHVPAALRDPRLKLNLPMAAE